VSTLLFVLALLALHRLLRDVQYRELLAQLHEVPWSAVVVSMAATAVSYAALMGYDWSALQYLGQRVPGGRLALASFCGYALGNTLGFAVLSGGAVRHRIYSALGMEAGDIVRISVFCAVAFGVGITLVGLTALAVHPDALAAVVPISPAALRAAALAGLGAAALLLAVRGVLGESIRVGRWTVRLPSAALIVGQIGFSVLDIGAAAAALFLLLPDSGVSLAAFVGLFALASVAGVLSHVPGGLGVFEGIMIAGLGGQVSPAALAAALVVYRGVYFLLPLALAVVLLVVNEVATRAAAERWRAFGARLAPLGAAGSRLVPLSMSAVLLVTGTSLLVKGVLPLPPRRLDEVRSLMTLEVFELSRLGASIVGALLVVLSRALLRRSRAALWVALVLTAAAAVESVGEGLAWQPALALTLAALVLWLCRGEFHRPARLLHDVLSPSWLLTMAALVAGIAWVLLFTFKSVPYSHELWWQFAFDAHAPRALRASLAGGIALVLAALAFAMRAPRVRPRLPASDELDRAAAVVRAQDDPEANLALVGDKALMFSRSGRSFVMYATQGRSWVALGAPVGPRNEAPELLAEFMDAAEAAGGRSVLYQVAPADLSLCLDAGFTLNKLGEEGLINLPEFDLQGPARKDLRYALRRGERDGLRFEVRHPRHDGPLLDALRVISDDWLATRHMREKAFSLGGFRIAYLQRAPLAIVREGGRITAFANVLTTDSRACATVDLMRHLPDAHALTMDYLFAQLLLALKAQGFARFSLGMAPLSGLAGPSRAWNRLGELVYRHAGHFYNFEGVRQYKEKFHPVWQPRYLATESGADPLRAAAEIALLCGGGLRGVLHSEGD
jgi:phosphatidylglycerol lysyltransferase